MNQAQRTTEQVSAVPKDQISSVEESLLEWYFGPAQALFERSTCGSMLDRLEAESMVSSVCRHCHGKGILEAADITPAMSRCRPCDGPARIEVGHEKKPACQWCWLGSGTVTEGCWCRACGGTGHTPQHRKPSKGEITVKPKTTNGNGFEVDDVALRRFAKVSRRISELYEKQPLHLQTLAAYYGQVGARYGRIKGRGRIFAVYALTLCGQRLVKRAQKFALDGTPLMAYQLIENEAEADKLCPDRNRTALLNQADEQARVLLRQAAQSWNLTSHRVKP